MNIKVLCFFLFLCLSAKGYAQSGWVVTGGINASTSLSSETFGTSSGVSKWGVGGYIGGLYDARLSKVCYLQPQLIFSCQTVRSEYADERNMLSVSRVYSLTLPVLLSFRIGVGKGQALRIGVGPYLQSILGARSHTRYGDNREQKLSASYELGGWKRFIGGVKGNLWFEHRHWIYAVEGSYALMRHDVFHGGHGLTLSAGVGYKF